MKKKLALFLSIMDSQLNVIVAPTLAWLAKSQGGLFDNYYASYHQGVHFQGGDARNLSEGQLTGGTVCGDRHFEELYFLLLNYEVTAYAVGNALLNSSLKNLDRKIIYLKGSISKIYERIFKSFGKKIPHEIVMLNADLGNRLNGINTYFYPEIYYRQALGVFDNIADDDLELLSNKKTIIYCVHLERYKIDRLQRRGYHIEVIEEFNSEDDYYSITKNTAQRWQKKIKGWILGDPTLVQHWIPKACEENLISVYSIPQEKIVKELGHQNKQTANVIFGRQYSDRDFFEISKNNQCLQVIDPCRPPFQSIKHSEYQWNSEHIDNGFNEDEYSDEQLKEFAQDGRILISLMFWSGMIREVANYYNLMDLFAVTKLRSGLVITSKSYEYMMHSPMEMLTVPLEHGGVYPLIEPILGSCGIGVGIEALIDADIVHDTLKEALDSILKKVNKQKLLPTGWWPTMDAVFEKAPVFQRPLPVKLIKYPPYLKIRYYYKEKLFEDESVYKINQKKKSSLNALLDATKQKIIDAGLLKYFEPYRPYEFYRAGSIKKGLIDAAKAAGLKYMFTKANFKEDPKLLYIDDKFAVLNYTSGQWDGWTPFETVNDVSDLSETEKKLLKKKKPGWIVSTIDSCLWTFSGEFWKNGSRLFKIAEFCSRGGASGKLINVKPCTIARYARIISQLS